MTSSLETEWDNSGRKVRDGQKKKTGKAKERKEKVERGKDEEVNGRGGRGVPRPHTGLTVMAAKHSRISNDDICELGLQFELPTTVTVYMHTMAARCSP